MGAHRPSKTDRKKLKVKPEVLYNMLSLRFGKPDLRTCDTFMAVRGSRLYRGIHAWMTESQDGREFAGFIAQCGEAKRRAAYWYRRWAEWCKEQQRGQASHP